MHRRPSRRAVVAAMACIAVVVLAATTFIGGSSRDQRTPEVPRAALRASPVERSTTSEKGALEAGVRYAALMAELFPLDSTAAKAIVDEIASRAYRPTLAAAVDTELVPLQRQVAGLAGRPVYRQSVLAAKLLAYAPPRAEVGAWVMLVAGQAGVDGNAMATFTTVTVGLVLENDVWRLDRTSEAPGPSPLLRDAPSTVDALVARLDGFADWRPAA